MPVARRPLVLPEHRIALVGEDPGRAGIPEWALYPYPPRCAGARMAEALGMTRSEYLATFARANVLGYYPGKNYPSRAARDMAPHVAAALAPRVMILLGRKVAKAFDFPCDHMTVTDYDLDGIEVRAASVPHPSGRNLWYNDPSNRERLRQWMRMVLYDIAKEQA